MYVKKSELNVSPSNVKDQNSKYVHRGCQNDMYILTVLILYCSKFELQTPKWKIISRFNNKLFIGHSKTIMDRANDWIKIFVSRKSIWNSIGIGCQSPICTSSLRRKFSKNSQGLMWNTDFGWYSFYYE